MARIVLRPDLGAVVASRFGTRAVEELRAAVADRVRSNAPPARIWLTVRDERVRNSHRTADSQTIPGNLRFQIDRPHSAAGHDTDSQARQAAGGAVELARAPRDEALSAANRFNCRCQAVTIDGAIAATVREGEVAATGESVRARVSATFPRLVESEHPSEGDHGGGWFARAVSDVAQRKGA